MPRPLKPKKPVVKVEAIEPQVIGEVVETEFAPATEVINASTNTFTVKLDSKKIEGRTDAQVSALVLGALGSVKKITIEQD